MINGALPNVKSKADVLKWQSLPEGECDLNYRLRSGPGDDNWPHCFGAAFIVSFVVAIGTPLFRATAVDAATLDAGVTFTIVAAVIAIASLCGWYSPLGPKAGVGAAAIAASGVYLFWLTLVIVGAAGETAPAMALLTALGIPASLYFSDQVATHFVYLASANPRLDHATMLGWRDDWTRRFSGIPDREPRSRAPAGELQQLHRRVLVARARYRWGLLFVVILGITSFIIAECGLIRDAGLPLSITFVTLLLVMLTLFGAVRILLNPDAVTLFIGAAASYLFYGSGRRLPPFVFQSPGGSIGRRQCVGAFAIGLLSLEIGPLLWSESAASMLTLVVRGLLSVLLPLFILLLIGFAVAGPVLSAHYVALEADGAYEQHHDWRPVDGYTERILHSRNPQERNCLFLGCFESEEYPTLLDRKLLNEHMHILGATGTGKTALGLAPLIIQLIRRGEGPVIIVDAKGDPFLMNLARREARRAGRKFKWFTNKPGHSTFIFNPFLQKHLTRLSLEETVGVLLQCFNLFHGTDYGRAWFTANSHALFRRAVTTFFKPTSQSRAQYGDLPLHSMRHLHQRLKQIISESKEFEAAQHLALVVESLTALDQLNLSPDRDPKGELLQHAIHMPDVIREKQVIYFYLTATTDISTVTEVARLALFTTLAAAMVHKQETNVTPKVSFICDEAQVLISQNLSNVMAQARSMGLSCILAHQTLDQLSPPGGGNFRQLVLNCTGVKQWFAVRDPESQDYLSKISGKVAQVEASWKLAATDFFSGRLSPAFASPNRDGLFEFQARMTPANRLDPEDISEINREQTVSVLIAERNEGYTQFVGPVAIGSEYAVSAEEYDWLNNESHWPQDEAGTMTIAPDGLQEFDIVPQTVPAEDQEAKRQASRDQVDSILRQVFGTEGE